MRLTLSALALLLPLPVLAGPRACPKPDAAEEFVYSNDFSWGMSLPDMQKRFDEIYASGKRLKGRAYYDDAQRAYVFPLEDGRKVRLDPRFVASVTRHVETALTRRYADCRNWVDTK